MANIVSLLITGDLNFHLNVLEDRNAICFNSTLSEFGLTQHIKEPTHILGHTLDVLITRYPSTILNGISVKDLCFVTDQGNPIADHLALTWNLVGNKKLLKSEKYTFRAWKNLDHEAFRNDLLESLLSLEQSNNTNLTELVNNYNAVLSTLADTHAPIKTIRVKRKHNPWYSTDISDMKKTRRQLERKYMHSRASIDYQNYKSYCIEFYKKIRLEKIKFCKNLLTKAGRDQKKLTSATNKILGCSNKKCYPEAESNQQLANRFMDFFTTKAHNVHVELLDSRSDQYEDFPINPPTLINFGNTNCDEVEKTISNLPNKQCILDPIPTYILKKHSSILAPFITKVINLSLESGHIPIPLKVALIRPVLKNPTFDTNELQSYRPVSNLPVLAKILEKIVSVRLTAHISAHNLLDLNQSAYRKYHSTETALLKIHNDILQHLDKDRIVALATIDVSSAFDTVNHQSLIDRFYHHFGLRETALKWLESYLKDREQSVMIDCARSDPVLLEHGFPQGATLAGIFYDMFTAPVGKVAEKHKSVDHHAYADDNNCYIAFYIDEQTEAIQKLNICVNDLARWMNSNFLKVNGSKTEAMFFFPKKNNPVLHSEVIVDSSVIFPSPVLKSLGVKMDSLLSMESHINYIARSTYFQIKRISKVRQFLDTDSTKSLVQNSIISRLDYCNSLLINLPKRLLQKLQKVMNHSARIIYRKNRRTRTTPLLKDLHWLPISYRIKFKILLMTYKCLNGLAPDYLSGLISWFVSSRALRSNYKRLVEHYGYKNSCY